jgi:hypothetical protein
VNERPTVNDQAFSLNEHSPAGTVVGVVTASDPDAGDTLTFVIVDASLDGAVAIDAVTGEITVSDTGPLVSETTPTLELIVVVIDQGLLTDTATVTVTIVNVNAPPASNADEYSVDQFGTLDVQPQGVLANDTDPDGDSLVSSLVAGTTSGSLTLHSDGSFTYTPDGDFVGADSFSYRASDGLEEGNVVTVTIVVDLLAPAGDSNSGSDDSEPTDTSQSSEGDQQEQTASEDDSADTETNDGAQTEASAPAPAARASSAPAEYGQPAPAEKAVIQGVDSLPQTDGRMFEERNAASYVSRGQAARSDGPARQSNEVPETDTPVQNEVPNVQMDVLWDRLDDLKSDLLGDASSKSLTQKLVVGSTAVTLSGLAVGYVAWALRVGYFITSMLSSLPAWTYFDPVPILDSFEESEASAKQPGKDEDDDTLESLVE